MINVKLINYPSTQPLSLAEHAAKTCYQAETPSIKKIDADILDFVDKRLFQTGHHTTLQHQYFTFVIENIAISDVTFGLHLTNPFYNSDQRSGRFCGQMFSNPNYNWIRDYIEFFWPKLEKDTIDEVLNFVKYGIKTYQNNINKATELAKQFLLEERPNMSEKNIDQNAPKIAQEQLRVFIPTILPTALDFTINLSTLIAMWKSAWTPVIRFVTDEMRQCVLSVYPELNFMFNEKQRNQNDWSPQLLGHYGILKKPECVLTHIDNTKFVYPKIEQTQPIDLLHFTPELMNNNIYEIRTEIKISVATMGQDQRHRTVKRGEPIFSNNFYYPPIVDKLNIENKEKLFKYWLNLRSILPATLHTAIAPYGAMVKYKKTASLNALKHEQEKRLCWCAQEEIYHLSRELRIQLEKKFKFENCSKDFQIVDFLTSPCQHTGKCVEGNRCCGKDIKNNEFPERRV